jgi:hypothetical protein
MKSEEQGQKVHEECIYITYGVIQNQAGASFSPYLSCPADLLLGKRFITCTA